MIFIHCVYRASLILLKLVSASPDSVSTKKKRELLESYKAKMELMNKRIEEAREKWSIVQSESTSANKQVPGSRTLRLTLEQELVIKGNLSEMYECITHIYFKIVFDIKYKQLMFVFFSGALQYWIWRRK